MMDLLVVSNILLWFTVVAMACVIFALVRQIGILYERVAPAGALAMNRKLKPGMNAPALTVTTLQGQSIVVGGERAKARSQLLFFLAPDCPVCNPTGSTLSWRATETILITNGSSVNPICSSSPT